MMHCLKSANGQENKGAYSRGMPAMVLMHLLHGLIIVASQCLVSLLCDLLKTSCEAFS